MIIMIKAKKEKAIVIITAIIITMFITCSLLYVSNKRPIVSIPVIAPMPTSIINPNPTAVPTFDNPVLASRSGAHSKDQTVKAINKFLKNKLKNKGEVIYNACKDQSPTVSAKLMTAIILVEVGEDCNSDLLRNASNVGGLNWYKGCGYPIYSKWYMDFSKAGGIDACIRLKANILSKYYIKEDRLDIIKIGLKYAPPNDPRNGIGGMDNTTWPDNVKYHYDRICSEASK